MNCSAQNSIYTFVILRQKPSKITKLTSNFPLTALTNICALRKNLYELKEILIRTKFYCMAHSIASLRFYRSLLEGKSTNQYPLIACITVLHFVRLSLIYKEKKYRK